MDHPRHLTQSGALVASTTAAREGLFAIDIASYPT
jgi:hypothetical protein